METQKQSSTLALGGRLSENQCGMETKGHISGNGCFELVEREPMWDGNEMKGVIDLCEALLSENQCGMETDFKNVGRFWGFVEREPMWDGNRTCLSISWPYCSR